MMDPAELRRFAENYLAWMQPYKECRLQPCDWRGQEQDVAERECHKACKAMANHILATVRDDDGEEPTPEFAESIGAPPAIIRCEDNCRVWVYKFEDERVTIRTRGQLRRLMEGLGITPVQ